MADALSVAPAVARTLAAYDTQQPADCVECVPARAHDATSNVRLVVCTYLLDTATNNKRGSLQFMCMGESSDAPVLEHRIDTGAVFDGKWACTHTHTPVLAYCTHNSHVGLVSWLQDAPPAEIASVNLSVGEESASVLAVHWPTPQCEDGLLASTAAGRVHSMAASAERLECGLTWKAHWYPGGTSAEVWTVAAPLGNVHEVWSGGDDARMRGWDMRCVARAALSACTTDCVY